VVVSSYAGDRAVPAETVALVAEVADSTAHTDLGRKVGLYGAAAIPEYWVIDVERACVVIFTGPYADGYRERREVPFGQPLAAITIPDLDLGVVKLVN